MSIRARALIVSILLPLALLACNRSEELGRLPDGAQALNGDAGCPDSGINCGNGFTCSSDSACTSGFCVGGFCCNTACTGSCMTCGAPGLLGVCTTLASCLAPTGATCTAGTDCATGFCIDGVCCNTACSGNCLACNAPGAVGTCTQTSTCAQPNGSSCNLGGDCVSGFCVGGVCCDTACTGTCMSCNVTGAVGTCSPKPSC